MEVVTHWGPPAGSERPARRAPAAPARPLRRTGYTGSAPRPSNPPWLQLARLPDEPSSAGDPEVTAFSRFVGAAPEERRQRAAVRQCVQRFVQLNVCPEATVKVVGGWATGLAEWSSSLDLAVESPTPPEALHAAFRKCLAVASIDYREGDGQIELSSAALVSDSSSGGGVTRDPYTVNVFWAEAPALRGPRRQATTAVAAAMKSFSRLRCAAIAIRAMLRQLQCVGADDGRLGGYAVDIMILGSFQRLPPDAGPAAALKHFFRLYSEFDFDKYSVDFTPGTTEKEGWPLKRHSEAQLSVVELCGGRRNAAASVTRLPQLIAMISYTHKVIQRWSRDDRGRTLLPSIVSYHSLGPRLAWLRDRGAAAECGQIPHALPDGSGNVLRKVWDAACKSQGVGDTDLGTMLFDHLFEIAPELRQVFGFDATPDGRAQLQAHAARVTRLLMSTLDSFTQDGTLLPCAVNQLRELGQRHRTYGVLPEQYALFGEAHIATLQYCLGPEDFGVREVRLWRDAYSILVSFL
eukprot:TRINITY_DN5585_c1_g1_i1.p1 TRINITY_DN5585_c1_g1~~TRINITY_DN5585_c1_g1_i1.p1  ORF type:complete len:521 (+),score=166.60 TRINITY_DN5585_c1_g1_i1:59-1621(+)